jgi:hypothetical protein
MPKRQRRTFVFPNMPTKRWLRRILPWMRSFKLLPEDTFWKIIPSTVEALVVCSTVLHKIVARFTLCVRQHDPCLLSSQFMNQNHRGG